MVVQVFAAFHAERQARDFEGGTPAEILVLHLHAAPECDVILD